MEDLNQSSSSSKMNGSGRDQSIDNLIHEAEDRFRRGVNTLSQWSSQARGLFERKPALSMAAVALAGFVVGLLVSRSSGQDDLIEE